MKPLVIALSMVFSVAAVSNAEQPAIGVDVGTTFQLNDKIEFGTQRKVYFSSGEIISGWNPFQRELCSIEIVSSDPNIADETQIILNPKSLTVSRRGPGGAWVLLDGAGLDLSIDCYSKYGSKAPFHNTYADVIERAMGSLMTLTKLVPAKTDKKLEISTKPSQESDTTKALPYFEI